MVGSPDSVSLYFDLYWKLKSKIILKELPPGSRIPTIEKLHQKYKISHGTVRKAMELLEREGLIIRKQRLGTFVRDDVEMPIWTLEESIKEIYRVLRSLTIEPLFEKWIDPPQRIVGMFQEYGDSLDSKPIYHIRRLSVSKSDRRKRMIIDIFTPAWVLDGVDIEELRYSPVYERVFKLKNIKAAHTVESIRPWLCDNESAEKLGVVAGTPLFHRTSVATDEDNRILFIRETLTTANIIFLEWDLK